jgi:hypothetical protein
VGGLSGGKTNLLDRDGIRMQVVTEVQRASQHLDKVEAWRKSQVENDPIAMQLWDVILA